MKNILKSSPVLRLHIPDFRRVELTLVGCGGTGSHIASGLVALQSVLAERGITMNALLIDPDIVEERNVGRQLFARGDIGKPKAHVIADRLNAAFGCRFCASVRAYDEIDIASAGIADIGALRIIVGAVDNASARQTIASAVKTANGALWWLDCGNDNHSGQIALGNTVNAQQLRGSVALGMIDRMPTPSVVYPDLVKTPKAKRAPRSCAEATASGEQSLMVNRVVAAYALELLHAFLVERDPKWFALAFNLRYGGTKPYAIDMPTLCDVTGLKRDELVVKGNGK